MSESLSALKDVDLSNAEEKRNYNRDLFDIVAPAYNTITILLSFGRDKAWKRLLVKNLPEGDNLNCLDIACGTADITTALAKQYPMGIVTGVDLNEAMIQNAREAHLYDNISFEIGDMCNLTQENETVDVLTGGYALRNAPDLAKALSEFNRVLKPNGKVLFLDFSKPQDRTRAAIEYGLLKFWGSLWGLVFHGKPEVYGYIAESLKRFPHQKALEAMLFDAGFTSISSQPLLGGFLALTTATKASAASQ